MHLSERGSSIRRVPALSDAASAQLDGTMISVKPGEQGPIRGAASAKPGRSHRRAPRLAAAGEPEFGAATELCADLYNYGPFKYARNA